MEFEDELRRALRPVEPPDAFEQEVLARLAARVHGAPATPAARPVRIPGLRMRVMAAAAASLVALGGAWYYQERGADQRGAHAARDARIALQIASEKLIEVQRRVNRTGESE